MKKSSIKILYRLFAFLSDKTNGFAPFVKYKLTLGALLIGFGACSALDNKIHSTEINANENENKQAQRQEAVFCYVIEIQPEFSGGDQARIDFIQKNLRYPETDSVIQGRVILNFIVEKDGTLNDITVIRSLAPEFDKEAVRIMELMPKWIPGKQLGENIRVRFTLPINFKK